MLKANREVFFHRGLFLLPLLLVYWFRSGLLPDPWLVPAAAITGPPGSFGPKTPADSAKVSAAAVPLWGLASVDPSPEALSLLADQTFYLLPLPLLLARKPLAGVLGRFFRPL